MRTNAVRLNTTTVSRLSNAIHGPLLHARHRWLIPSRRGFRFGRLAHLILLAAEPGHAQRRLATV